MSGVQSASIFELADSRTRNKIENSGNVLNKRTRDIINSDNDISRKFSANYSANGINRSYDLATIKETKQAFKNSNTSNILTDLGVTFLENENGKVMNVKAPFLNNIKFEFLEDGETATLSTNQLQSKDFEPNRVYGVIEISREFLSGTENENMEQFLLSHSEKAVSEAIFDEVIKRIEEQTAISGYTSTDTAKAFNLADINSIEASLNELPYTNKKYVVSNSDSQKLKQIDSGFNSPLLQRGYLNDLQCFSHRSVSDGSLILADWSQVYVLVHTMQITVDPFTRMDEGVILINFSTYLDIDYDLNSVSIAKNFTV